MSPPRSCFAGNLSGVCGSSGMLLVEHASPNFDLGFGSQRLNRSLHRGPEPRFDRSGMTAAAMRAQVVQLYTERGRYELSTHKADGRKYLVQVNAVCAHEDSQAGVSISMSGALPSLSP